MLKSKKPFIVEIKSSRRKTNQTHRNEIWKDIDVKNILQRIEVEHRDEQIVWVAKAHEASG